MSSTGALTRCEPCRLRFVASSRGFTDAQDEAQPLRREDLESGRHASAGRTDLTQFQGCATSLQGRSQAFDDGTFRVVLSVFAPLTGVLLTLSATSLRGRPPRDVRTSPTGRPADSAGDPEVTSARNTPWRLAMP